MHTNLLARVAIGLLAASPLTSQIVGSSAAVTSPLTSSGYNCWSQSSWNHSVPVGPLAAGVTGLTGSSWTLGSGSLAASASGSGGLCSFYLPASYASAGGQVQVTLFSPFDTAVMVSVAGSVSGPSTGGGSLPVGGFSNFSAKVDGVTLGSAMSGGSGPSSVNQSTQVMVGPAGVVLSLQIGSTISGGFGSSGSTSVSVNLSWSQLDSAAVISVPGGCASPTPTFVATGLPIIGTSMEADILQAQGPSPLGFAMFGLEQATIPLDSIGMPGCNAMQPMFMAFVAQPTGPNELHLSVPLPNHAWLIGVMLYSQAFTQAIGVNPNNLVAGDALHWRLGT